MLAEQSPGVRQEAHLGRKDKAGRRALVPSSLLLCRNSTLLHVELESGLRE